MSKILLSTLNARYAHASLGLRYLRSNLGKRRDDCAIQEFVIGQKTEEIAERILAAKPKILGLGVYIWNVEESQRLVAMLKAVAPDLIIVLGGPEVSYETTQQEICNLADYVITGWGDISFAQLVEQLLQDQRPEAKIIPGIQAKLSDLILPYDEYTDEDVRKRYIYVEASRGCPFKCEFCLSALDKTAWPFPLEPFMQALARLYDRGVRQFKFVDRTFNLKVDTSLSILNFFLDKLTSHPEDPVFVHFELIPDHLPEKLKQAVTQFPPGTLQFEIGIQTFNPEVQSRISRKQKNNVAKENIQWLRENTNAHLHVDLIAGLPGETVDEFACGFDQLVDLKPHEIQFGILKRLRGAPIARHTQEFGLRFNPLPPYNILATDVIDFATMQRLSRFARYWDMIANSGRYQRSLWHILGASPFERFLQFSDWLWTQTGRTHAIAQDRLVEYIYSWLSNDKAADTATAAEDLALDYHGSGGRRRLSFEADDAPLPKPRKKAAGATPARQSRHLQSGA